MAAFMDSLLPFNTGFEQNLAALEYPSKAPETTSCLRCGNRAATDPQDLSFLEPRIYLVSGIEEPKTPGAQ
jgi:hypothetical protein